MLGSIYFGQAYLGQGFPARIYWGVDSVTHADELISGATFFDLVTAHAGRAPEFWGRYIGSPTASFNLTSSEAKYLHGRNCRILLVYNGHTGKPVATYANGQEAANTAIARARELAVPENGTVWLYCDIEPNQSPTADFFRGWFETVQSSGYRGGVYGTTSAPSFNAAYCAAYAAPALLWNTQPQLGSCNMLYRTFNPNRPSPCNAPTVIHQYKINCPVSGAQPFQQVDLNLANDWGFQRMWAPSQRWEAYLVSTDANESYRGVRQFDVLASGRIVLVATVSTTSVVRARYSDDKGKTWSTAFNSSTVVGADLSYMTLVERGGKIHVFFRGEASADQDLIYRITFDPVALTWGALTLFVDFGAAPPGLADMVFGFWAARRRDRSEAGLVVEQWVDDTTFNKKYKFIPINADGTAGATQMVHAGDSIVVPFGFDPFNSALVYREDGNPAALIRWEPRAEPGTVRLGRKQRSGGVWPGGTSDTGWSVFPIDDPPTNPDIFTILDTYTSDLVWGGASIASNGDAHALKITAGDPVTAVMYRKRINNGWSETTINFKVSSECNPPISGAGSDSLEWHSMPVLIEGNYTTCVMSLNDSLGNKSTWFVRKLLV